MIRCHDQYSFEIDLVEVTGKTDTRTEKLSWILCCALWWLYISKWQFSTFVIYSWTKRRWANLCRGLGRGASGVYLLRGGNCGQYFLHILPIAIFWLGEGIGVFAMAVLMSTFAQDFIHSPQLVELVTVMARSETLKSNTAWNKHQNIS